MNIDKLTRERKRLQNFLKRKPTFDELNTFFYKSVDEIQNNLANLVCSLDYVQDLKKAKSADKIEALLKVCGEAVLLVADTAEKYKLASSLFGFILRSANNIYEDYKEMQDDLPFQDFVKNLQLGVKENNNEK